MTRTRWLLQSAGSWLSASTAESVAACVRGSSPAYHVPCLLGSSLLADAYRPHPTASMHTPGLVCRAYSTPSTSTAKADGGGTPEAPRKRVLPLWIRDLFAGGRNLASPTPATPAPQQPEEGKGAESKEADDVKELEELQNMDLKGYVEYCKQLRGPTAVPRPRAPPVPRGHPDYDRFLDLRRIMYLRYQQHERIASVITAEEDAMIQAEDDKVLKNRKLLQAIADRTGVYIDLEVKDCLQEYLNSRRGGKRLLRYVKEFGMPMPKTRDAQEAAMRFVKEKEAEERGAKALAKRDPAACSLRHGTAWAGAGAVCERTNLRYWQCCGALAAEASGRPPHFMEHSEQSEKEALQERHRWRGASAKFKGRSRTLLRKGYLHQQKPRFRDY